MKLREGWKSHGRYWRYKENEMGLSVESVVQFTDHGVKRYEAHYYDNSGCGYCTWSDAWKYKRFDNREDAFIFCEQAYIKRKG